MRGEFFINGKREVFNFDSGKTLLRVLRENGHTEVRNGCETGECGACVVLLEGIPVNSCQVLAASVVGKEITTIKGLNHDTIKSYAGTTNFLEENLHPVQRAFVDAGAVQCGFCTPGKVLVTYALLKKNPDPTEEEILNALDGNLCRCTGYTHTVESVKLAAEYLNNQSGNGLGKGNKYVDEEIGSKEGRSE